MTDHVFAALERHHYEEDVIGILRLHRSGTGILKICKTLGIGTGTVQRVLMEHARPFDVDAAEPALACQ